MAKSQSQLLKNVDKRVKGGAAYKKSRERKAQPKGARLPGNLIDALGVMSGFDVDENDAGDPVFILGFVAREPEEVCNIKSSIRYTLAETENKTVQDKLDDCINDLMILGADCSDVESAADVLQVGKALAKETPYFRFNTRDWAFKGRDGKEVTGVSVFPQRLEEGEIDDGGVPFEPAEEPEDQGFQEGESVIVTDENGEWGATFVQYDSDEKATVTAEEDGENYEVEVANLSEVADEDPEEEPADEEPEAGEPETEATDEEWEPDISEVYNYKASPKGKPLPCEVMEVDSDSRTVTLKRVSDEREFKNISWDKLEGDE